MSFRPSASSFDCSNAASRRSTSTGPADRSVVGQAAELLGLSLARASTSAAVVRLATGLVAAELAEQEREEALIGFAQAAGHGGQCAQDEARPGSWRRRRC